MNWNSFSSVLVQQMLAIAGIVTDERDIKIN